MEISSSSRAVNSKSAHNHNEGHLHLFEGIHFKFPTFKHDHPAVIDVNAVADEQLTLGQRIADKVAARMGSWNFIIGQALIMVVWIMLNLVGWFYHWDVYPFVLLNLAMSAQAAFATPLIMMSQNRQAEKDRLTAQNDYQTDCKGEQEIRFIMEHLDHQDTLILQILQRLEAQEEKILHRLAQIDPETAWRLVGDIKQISQELSEEGFEVSGNS